MEDRPVLVIPRSLCNRSRTRGGIRGRGLGRGPLYRGFRTCCESPTLPPSALRLRTLVAYDIGRARGGRCADWSAERRADRNTGFVACDVVAVHDGQRHCQSGSMASFRTIMASCDGKMHVVLRVNIQMRSFGSVRIRCQFLRMDTIKSCKGCYICTIWHTYDLMTLLYKAMEPFLSQLYIGG